MPNMSYCRFHNTLHAMQECDNAMDEAADLAEMDLSDDEMRAFTSMFNLMQHMVEKMEQLAIADEREIAES